MLAEDLWSWIKTCDGGSVEEEGQEEEEEGQEATAERQISELASLG